MKQKRKESEKEKREIKKVTKRKKGWVGAKIQNQRKFETWIYPEEEPPKRSEDEKFLCMSE